MNERLWPRRMCRCGGALVALAVTSMWSAALAQAQDEEPPPIRALAFSADGRWLAAASGEAKEAGEVVVWDLKTRKPHLVHREKQAVSSVAFSPDSKVLAIGLFGDECKLLDVETKKVTAVLAGHGEAARNVAFSPDGALLAVASYDSTIRLWDWRKAKLIRTLEGHKEWVYDVAFDHAGKRMISAGRDKTVRLWDVASGKLLKTFDGYGDILRNVVFGPQSKWFAATCWDGSVKVRDTETGKVLIDFAGRGSGEGLAVSKDGKTLLVARFRAVEIHPVTIEPFNADEKKRIAELLEMLDDDDIKTRDRASDELLRLGPRIEPVLREAMKTGKSAEVKLRARRMRVALREQPAQTLLKGHEETVECVRFSPDGGTLASAGRDGIVLLWDAKSWKKSGELRR